MAVLVAGVVSVSGGVARACDAEGCGPPQDKPRECHRVVSSRQARVWDYDDGVFFPLTRCTTAGDVPPAVAAALMPITVPIDVVLLPASALVGLFQLY